MASPQIQPTKPEAAPKPANGGAPAPVAPTAEAKPAKAARGTKKLSAREYVNAVESARKRANDIETRLLKQVPEEQRERAQAMLKLNDGK